MKKHAMAGLVWRKSTFSNPNGECVEVAESKGRIVINGRVLVRDGKQPDKEFLSFTPGEWHAFIAGVREGQFDISR